MTKAVFSTGCAPHDLPDPILHQTQTQNLTQMKPLTVLLASCLLCSAGMACAQASTETPSVSLKESGFSLPPLPYATDALGVAIDAETMAIHHGKHHQGYVNNLNKAIATDPSLASLTLEQLVAKAGTLSTAIRDNAGGHWNHSFFWTGMAPPTEVGEPSAELLAAIEASFGSLDGFKKAFSDAGLKRFGSGWVWLILDESGELAVTSTPNQDNPLMDIAEVRGTPLLGNDVWEHAYYLKYQHRRGDYLNSWWQVVNWDEISRRYAAASASN